MSGYGITDGVSATNPVFTNASSKSVTSTPVQSATLFTNAADAAFTSNTGHWTLGSGWTISGNKLNTAGSSSAATLANTYLTAPIAAGMIYLLTFTLANTANFNTMNITCGGVTVYSGFGNYNSSVTIGPVVFTAINANILTINSGTFVGSVTNLVLTSLTSISTVALSIQNSDGSQGFDVRSGGIGLVNMFFGTLTGSNCIGNNNIALGNGSFLGVSSSFNVAIGPGSLASTGVLNNNVAVGYQAANLWQGGDCVAIGYRAGYNNNSSNSSASSFIAIGSNTPAGLSTVIIGNGASAGSQGISIGVLAGTGSSSGVNVGYNAGSTNNGSSNVCIGLSAGSSGGSSNNVYVGCNYCGYGSSGGSNVAIGNGAMGVISAKSTANCVAIGDSAFKAATSATNCVAIGYFAGRYVTTSSNEFFLNNQDRTNYAGDQTKSLVYGTFAATTAAQYFRVNGNLQVFEQLTLPKTSGYGIKVDTTTPTWPWRDLEGILIWDQGGANAFSLATYRGGAVREFAGSATDKLDCKFHIPHDYAPGTDLFIHIHWSHNGTAITGDLGADIAYTYAKGHQQAIFPTEKVIPLIYSTVSIATTPQYRHNITEVQLSSAGGSATLTDSALIEVDGILLANVTLTAIPTITGGSPNEPFVHFVDLHYQSTGMGTKQKAPSFWV
jgi:hypothetical protein